MMGVLIVIPALNEAAHIGGVLDTLLPFARAHGARIVVADGGSTDGTVRIVADRAASAPEIALIDNPDRLQSAGVNLAVAGLGGPADWLIRVDAHSLYPQDFCACLLDEAERTGADAVVVGMTAAGTSPLQRLIALAQNSRLGNGGAAHRASGGGGAWVDHGHHALIRMASFRGVGGYDPTFSTNEDAEFDHRLRASGGRIWLTDRTRIVYLPRGTLRGLMRQYFRFGRGRARNLLLHRVRPAVRQAAVAALAPLLGLALLAPVHPLFALPLAGWLMGCTAGGLMLAVSTRDAKSVVAGFIAGTMHLAWSAGFWTQVIAGAPSTRMRT